MNDPNCYVSYSVSVAKLWVSQPAVHTLNKQFSNSGESVLHVNSKNENGKSTAIVQT